MTVTLCEMLRHFGDAHIHDDRCRLPLVTVRRFYNSADRSHYYSLLPPLQNGTQVYKLLLDAPQQRVIQYCLAHGVEFQGDG